MEMDLCSSILTFVRRFAYRFQAVPEKTQEIAVM